MEVAEIHKISENQEKLVLSFRSLFDLDRFGRGHCAPRNRMTEARFLE